MFDNKKNILVIGSSGFIGGSLANYFSRTQEYCVSGYGTLASLGGNSLYDYRQDRLDPAKLRKTLHQKRQNIVIDCTGPNSVYVCKTIPNEMLEKSLEETLGFCDATIGQGGLFVYISSAAVYGNNSKCSENAKLAPISKYGEHKALVERKLNDYYGKTGRLKVVRPFSVYGHLQKKQLIWDAYQKLSLYNNPVFFGTGKETRDWMHIEDLCELLEKFIMSMDQNLKIINAGTGSAISVEVAIRHIADCAGIQKSIIFDQIKSIYDPFDLIADTAIMNESGFQHKKNFFDGISSCINAWKN